MRSDSSRSATQRGRTSMRRARAFGTALLAVCIAASASHAAQSVTRFGSTQAQACYRAADERRSLHMGLEACNAALSEELLNPRDRAATFVNRGIIKVLSDNFEGALADYNASIALVQDLGEAYVNRGLLYVRQHNRDLEAIAEIDRGLALGIRDEGIAWFGRAVALENLGRTTEAYKNFKRAAELSPDWAAPKQELSRFSLAPGSTRTLEE